MRSRSERQEGRRENEIARATCRTVWKRDEPARETQEEREGAKRAPARRGRRRVVEGGRPSARAGGDKRAVDAGATRDGTASRGDAQSRPSQSGADIRAITLSTVLKIPRSCSCRALAGARGVIDKRSRRRAAVDRRRVAIDARQSGAGRERAEKKREKRQPGESFPGSTRRARRDKSRRARRFEFDRINGGTHRSA